ncbi:MAG: hypothetical protein QF464_12695, partial [Myxococcota bacterium]|nr:hypothetical protein [Myxococcota bacterium]
LVPAEARGTAGFVGLGAVRRLGPPGGVAQAPVSAALATDGATLVVADHWPVETLSDIGPGHHVHRLVLAGARVAGCGGTAASWWDNTPDNPMTVDGDVLRDRAGRAVSGASFLVLDMHVDVPHHE